MSPHSPPFLRSPLHLLGLAALMVALAVAVASARAQSATAAPAARAEAWGGPHARGGEFGGPGAQMFSGRMLDSVGATPDQKSRIRTILEAARTDLAPQREAGRATRQQMMQLMAAPTVDTAAAEALRQQQMARYDAVSKRMFKAMIDVQTVLTPEQRQKLVAQIGARREMMERHRREFRQLQAPAS